MMNHQADQSDNQVSETSVKVAAKKMNRRQLLKLGAGVAPVLMTLSSRSAFGCHSTTPSAFGSVCASRPDVLKPLSGCNPSYWANPSCHSSWPSPHCATQQGTTPATCFNTVFGSTGSPFKSTVTLLQVLQTTTTSGKTFVARCMATALLNACSHRTDTVLNQDAVKNMWKEYVTKGYFEPTAGVKWYATTPTLSNGIANTAGYGGIAGYCHTTWS